MKKVFLRSLIITLIIQLSGFFAYTPSLINFFQADITQAQSPDVPIFSVFRDATGGENITTVPQTLSWDTLVSENVEIPIDAGNDGFDLTQGGNYLVMYSVPVRSTSGSNRSEVQSWLNLNGTTDIPYSYASSYIRRVDNDFEGYNEGAAVVNAAAGDNISVRVQKTDTNGATMERTPNRSGINILKLDDDWNYAQLRPVSAQAVTTTWEEVNLGIVDELDNAGYTISGNDITLGETGKYLVTYSVGTTVTGTDRTNNEIRLTLDNSEIEATRSTAYIRAQNGSFTGIASYVGIIDASASQILNLEVRRESTLQGTTNNTVPTKSGITITKLPDTADYVRIGETIGGQDINPTSAPVTFDTTIEQGESLQHDSVNSSEIDINTDGDYLFFHSIYNRRTGTNNGPRENPYLQWQVSGSTIQYGTSGSYNRNANDADGITNSSHSSAGVIFPNLLSGDNVVLNQTNEASNGPSVYEGGQMGIQGVNLASLFLGGAILSQPTYRWRDDSADFDSDAGWLAGENISISNIRKNEALRLRMKVENPSTDPYNIDSQFEIQWAQSSGICSSGLSWNSISDVNDDWEMADSAFISPNAETSSVELLSNPKGNIHISSEGYHAPAGETLPNPSGTFVAESQKEYEFSLMSTSVAGAGNIYCFRLFNIEESKGLNLNNYPKVQLGTTPVVLDDVWGEAGRIEAPANGAWTTVTFEGGPYTSPVIVGRTNTHNDPAEALVFESRNMTSTSVDVRLCDSNSGNSTGCQAHLAETIGYIVVDAAQIGSIDGIDAGTFSADESFDTAAGLITTNFNESFSTIPYVFTSIQSTNGDTPIVTRVSNTTLTNFTGGICQQISTDDCNASHPTETFGWIAIDPTMNPFLRQMDIGSLITDGFSGTWMPVTFSAPYDAFPIGLTQAVTNLGGQDVQIDEVQNLTTTGMEIRSCELDNDDDCDTHNPDTLVWMAIEEGIFAAEYFLDKTHYRWYANNNANTPTVALADENTTLSSLPVNEQVRLRILLQNGDPELPANVLSLNLQYAAGTTCESLTGWTDVGASGGTGDWLHFDNSGVSDGATLTNSLLFGGGHNLQSYSESLPTVSNPNIIPVSEWGEWDFSLVKNAGAGDQYCFRVVTENDEEIVYSDYARIDTSDSIDPVINSVSLADGSLLPIGNTQINYIFSDPQSGIDTSSVALVLQKWDGSIWGTNIAGSFASLNAITITGASYDITGLDFGRYRVAFQISDNAGNSSTLFHEFFVDEIEFTISDSMINVGSIDMSSTLFTSSDILTVTVKTVGVGFHVDMLQQADLDNNGDIIPDWDGSMGFGYDESPFVSANAFGSGNTVLTQARDIHPDGEKYTYSVDLQYGVLLDLLENHSAGNYESLLDFNIVLDYN